jgi:hypothetical protein
MWSADGEMNGDEGSHGVDPSHPMGQQGPALLARLLFERYLYGPLALLLWVRPMTQWVDLTRSHFEWCWCWCLGGELEMVVRQAFAGKGPECRDRGGLIK